VAFLLQDKNNLKQDLIWKNGWFNFLFTMKKPSKPLAAKPV